MCFQTHQPQVSDSSLLVQILHTMISQFGCPVLNTFKQFNILTIVRTPYLAAIFQVWSYQTLI